MKQHNFNIIQLDTCSSTNTLLKEEDYPFNTCLTSCEQTAGRGRLSRKFVSQKGKGLYFSVLLDKEQYHKVLNRMTCLVASIIRRALIKQNVSDVLIKWVNDLYLNNKKISGILTEVKNNKLIIGAGINLLHQVFPNDINATSIEDELGITVDKELLLNDILEGFSTLEEDQNELMDEYKKFNIVIHQQVNLLISEAEVEAYIEDISSDGELIATINGKTQILTSCIITKVSIL